MRFTELQIFVQMLRRNLKSPVWKRYIGVPPLYTNMSIIWRPENRKNRKNLRILRPHVIGFVADLFFFHSGDRLDFQPFCEPAFLAPHHGRRINNRTPKKPGNRAYSGERIKKYPDSLPNSRDVCGRKPYPERKSCGFKNIRIRVDGT